MIQFKQKEFSEYDAMRQLYVAMDKLGLIRNRVVGVIDQSALIPILKGNNVVIEKFTQATRIFGKDRYRMYLKIGAKAKMPDEVRLPQLTQRKSLGSLQLGLNYGIMPDNNGGGGNNNNNNNQQNNNQKPPQIGAGPQQNQGGNNQNNNNQNQNQQGKNKKNKKKGKRFSDTSLITFRQKEFGGPPPVVNVSFKPNVDFLNYEINSLLADAIKYDKRDRSLVLEVSSVDDAIKALNLLPFGLGYKVYLLNS